MTDEEAKAKRANIERLLREAAADATSLSMGGFDVQMTFYERGVQTLGDAHPKYVFEPKVAVSRRI
jgi:hypothetical protein